MMLIPVFSRRPLGLPGDEAYDSLMAGTKHYCGTLSAVIGAGNFTNRETFNGYGRFDVKSLSTAP